MLTSSWSMRIPSSSLLITLCLIVACWVVFVDIKDQPGLINNGKLQYVVFLDSVTNVHSNPLNRILDTEDTYLEMRKAELSQDPWRTPTTIPRTSQDTNGVKRIFEEYDVRPLGWGCPRVRVGLAHSYKCSLWGKEWKAGEKEQEMRAKEREMRVKEREMRV